MAILSKGTTFTSSQQVTSGMLNALVDSATFASGAADHLTITVNDSGSLEVMDLGVTSSKLASDSVTTGKLADASVTPAKLSAGAPTWDGTESQSLSFADKSVYFEVVNTESSATRTPSLRVVHYSGGQGGVPRFISYVARGTKATPGAVQTDDGLGAIDFTGHNGTNFVISAQILALAKENHGGSGSGTVLLFRNAANGETVVAERMRLSETGGLLIGTTGDIPSAVLTVTSVTKGFLPPRMTTTQRNAISSPVAGLMIYNTTTQKLNFHNGSSWQAVTSA